MELEKEPSLPSRKSFGVTGAIYILLSSIGFWLGWVLSRSRNAQAVRSNTQDPIDRSSKEKNGGSEFSVSSLKGSFSRETPEQWCKCCHHKTPTWKILVEWLTFLVAAGAFAAATIYAGITYRMWGEMQEQTRIQREARRPWIGTVGQVHLGAPPDYQVIVPGQISLRLQGIYLVRNFGSSPAFYVNGRVGMEYLMSDSTVTRPPEKRMMCFDGPTKEHQGEVIFPGSDVNFGFDETLARSIPGKDIKEVARVWLVGCVSYMEADQKKIHHTKFWLRSAHPDDAHWIKLSNKDFRYMPITGFESWGEEAD